jgi:hypothetical protein
MPRGKGQRLTTYDEHMILKLYKYGTHIDVIRACYGIGHKRIYQIVDPLGTRRRRPSRHIGERTNKCPRTIYGNVEDNKVNLSNRSLKPRPRNSSFGGFRVGGRGSVLRIDYSKRFESRDSSQDAGAQETASQDHAVATLGDSAGRR